MNLPYAIIPDIHEDLETLNKILFKFRHIPNKIFLGDWYDSFTETHADHIKDVARTQKEIIEDPRNICLLGNHDAQYAFPLVRDLKCSGYRFWKQEPIDSQMKGSWSKVKLHKVLFCENKTWILSHAGYNHKNISEMENFTGYKSENHFSQDDALKLDQRADQALQFIRETGRCNRLLDAGWARSGPAPLGGVTWLDFNEEFEPIEGINQIVGHTKGHEVKAKHGKMCENWCIDTKLHHVAILEPDGTCNILPV